MQSIKTACPHCQKRYTVSVLKLRVAQGHVTCATCHHVFNAYRQMLSSNIKTHIAIETAPPTRLTHPVLSNHEALQIFETKTKSSNIDLQTYLNTIQTFQLNTIKPSNGPLPHLLFKDTDKSNAQLYWIFIFLCICFMLTVLPLFYYAIIHSTWTLF